MAKTKQKNEAIRLRKEGYSYSYIKEKIGVGKGTLSVWLRDYPLSQDRLVALRDRNPKRIEKFRQTMAQKRQDKLDGAYVLAKEVVGGISDRELLIAGFALYWAEGLKASDVEVSLANTDPAMILLFIRWLDLIGVKKNDLKVRLHLYSDMDVKEEMSYWSKALSIPVGSFKKPYIKKAKKIEVRRKGQFGHGTCNIQYYKREKKDFVLMGLKCLREHAETVKI